MTRDFSVEIKYNNKIIWTFLPSLITLIIALGSNWVTFHLTTKNYELDKEAYNKNIELNNKQIEDLQQVNRLNALITIGDKMSENIDAVNIIEAGLNKVDDEDLKKNLEKMKEKYKERNRTVIRRRVSQLYDSSESIRENAVTEILNISSSETIADIINTMCEYDDFYSKNEINTLSSGRYNSMYIISLLDTSLFGIEYNGKEYVISSNATDRQENNLKILKNFIESYKNNSNISLNSKYYILVNETYMNN